MNQEHVAKLSSLSSDSLHNVVSIVAAYVGNNSLRAADLPELIGAVHLAINRLAMTPGDPDEPAKAAENPAVAIKKSVTKDHIICLEDGKKFKSLRRHLSSFHGLTPDAYRAKWNLPSDYPMVAPTYSATRSQLAKDSGLGQVTRGSDLAPAVKEPASVPKKAGRGRPRKIREAETA